eukprot:g7409.t1
MGGICAKREEEPFFLPEDHPEVIARQEKWGLKKKKSLKDRRHTPANIGDEAKAVEDYREEMLKKMQDNMEVVQNQSNDEDSKTTEGGEDEKSSVKFSE